MTKTYACPNCGANVRHDGRAELARCTFCGTQVVIPVRRSRTELETERDQLLARESERDTRMQEARTRGVEDYVVPPFGCCGIYVGLFVVGSLILSVLGLKESKPHTSAVAAIAIAAALIGAVVLVWRRESRRRERVLSLEREWKNDRELRQKRLREIEAELDALTD